MLESGKFPFRLWLLLFLVVPAVPCERAVCVCVCLSVRAEVLRFSQEPQSVKSLGIWQPSPWFCTSRQWHRPYGAGQKHQLPLCTGQQLQLAGT